MSLVADFDSLSFLERQASGAMSLVADIGSLSFLERHSSGASRWLLISVHCSS